MTEFTITLGNKCYSSWSLRGWLALKQTGASFDEIVIPLRQADSRARILATSPSGRVPVLRHGELTVWDSLAIGEYLAERFPDAGLWPSDPVARAIARAVVAEMHAGFVGLRRNLPMDLRCRHPGFALPPGVGDEVARIVALWHDCRSRFGRDGAFLFGRFTLADAAFAPVVTRFVTYDVALGGTAAAYRDAVLAWPDLIEWTQAARAEPWIIEFSGLPAPSARP